MSAASVEIFPAAADRWEDVASIFEDCADGRRCWCAYWYLPNKDYKAGWGPGNRPQLEKRVREGREPGIVAYVGGEPAGWASIAPRAEFDRLNRSRPLAPVDDQPAWAMNCFIVKKKFRRQGLVRQMAKAGIDFVRERGGSIIEAYPVDAERKLTGYDLFLGTIGVFRELGFEEAARRLPSRPIMRLRLY